MSMPEVSDQMRADVVFCLAPARVKGQSPICRLRLQQEVNNARSDFGYPEARAATGAKRERTVPGHNLARYARKRNTRLGLFRLFACVAFLFGLVRLADIRSVTAISDCITYPCHTPARTASQRTSSVEAEADVANGFTAEALFYFSQDFGLGVLFELVVQCRYADIEDSLAKCDWREMYGVEVADNFRPRVDDKRSSV